MPEASFSLAGKMYDSVFINAFLQQYSKARAGINKVGKEQSHRLKKTPPNHRITEDKQQQV